MSPHALRLTVHVGTLWAASTMHGKCRSEFETYISYNALMHFRHRQMDRQTDTDIVA